ncbi:MAG: hypothetical protein MUE99_09565 [Chitinophagaceae bacterium]|nr:hypothetical protein [Chitinophagaceae bacterium]
MKNYFLVVLLILSGVLLVRGQDATQLVKNVKAKLERVKDYSANATLRTDVPFLKVPVADVQVYFKLPNQFKITKEKGISILPKDNRFGW